MTDVRITRSMLGRTITAKGHAAMGRVAAPAVCTALSILLYTIEENVLRAENIGGTDIIDLTVKSGDATISYITDSDELNIITDGICRGIELLSEEYPESITLDITDEYPLSDG